MQRMALQIKHSLVLRDHWRDIFPTKIKAMLLYYLLLLLLLFFYFYLFIFLFFMNEKK